MDRLRAGFVTEVGDEDEEQLESTDCENAKSTIAVLSVSCPRTESVEGGGDDEMIHSGPLIRAPVTSPAPLLTSVFTLVTDRGRLRRLLPQETEDSLALERFDTRHGDTAATVLIASVTATS